MSETTLRARLNRLAKDWEQKANAASSSEESDTWREAADELRIAMHTEARRLPVALQEVRGEWTPPSRPVVATSEAVTGGQVLRWLSEHDHVHTIDGLCVKDRTGLCTAPMSAMSNQDGRGLRFSATGCTCLLRGPHLEHVWWYTREDGGHMITPSQEEKETGRYAKWLCPGRRVS